MQKACVLVFALLGVTNALRCYQGQQSVHLIECLENSMTCILTLDSETNTATHACQISNCSINGFLTAAPVCTNTTSKNGSVMTFCCCYGDGCNDGYGYYNTTKIPASAEKNLAGSVAGRIEDFYDRDAVPAERTFIRRVVSEVYQHIDRESKDND